MALTAADIQNVSFSIDRKGYDVDEVDVFLERVAEEIDAMNRHIADLESQLEANKSAVAATSDEEVSADGAATDSASTDENAAEITRLQKQVEELETKLSEKSANDSAISQALIVAQRSADDIVANARAEASNIVKDADEEADRIIAKAESDRLKIAESIRTLESDRADVRSEYREMLANFMADAQHKLNEIDGDARRAAAAAQVRADTNASGYAPAPVSDMFIPAGTGMVQPSAPAASSYVDKDFSGYGDADDNFVFDID